MINTAVSAVSVLLVVLMCVNWWAVWIVAGAVSRNGHALHNLGRRFTLTAMAATCMGVLGVNWLTGAHLTRGVGLIILTAGALMISASPVYFLYTYYRSE